ncbi:MAG: cytochrome c [Magnetococcales bacterium]|nr:cytochrome c [Magnetococcales bacterium]
MKQGMMWGLGLAALLLGSHPLFAADTAKGKALHDAGCLGGCHASKGNGDPNALYQRSNRKDSLEKLRAQVAFCNQQVLHSKWFPEDEADVVEYLNATFYHFKLDK